MHLRKKVLTPCHDDLLPCIQHTDILVHTKVVLQYQLFDVCSQQILICCLIHTPQLHIVVIGRLFTLSRFYKTFTFDPGWDRFWHKHLIKMSYDF